MFTNKIVAIAIFIFAYIAMLLLPRLKTYIALFCGALFVSLKILSFTQIAANIDFGVLMMIGGSMGLMELFSKSKMPSLLAEKLLMLSKTYMWAVVTLSCFAGLLSAFVDNVATVLMVAPIAIELAKKTQTSPIPAVIAIAVASNLQGAATLVGDTTSIMLGGFLDMSFLDFFVYKNHLSLFFIVQLSAIAATAVLIFILRKDVTSIEIESNTKVKDFFPAILLCVMLITMIGLSFVDKKPSYTLGLVTCVLFFIGLVYDLVRYKDIKTTFKIVREIDFGTIAFLAGLFLLIGGIKEQGIIDDLAQQIINMSKDNLFLLYTIIVFISVVISAFIDNIPYIATMLPVVQSIGGVLGGDVTVLFFGLLAGATLGGNITPIGSSANLTALGILNKNGFYPSSRQFLKISFPYTIVAVLVGYMAIWVLFSP